MYRTTLTMVDGRTVVAEAAGLAGSFEQALQRLHDGKYGRPAAARRRPLSRLPTVDDTKVWVEVVPALPAAEADAAWIAWLADRGGRPMDLGEVIVHSGQAIVNSGQATCGAAKFYRVRRSALDT